MSEEPIYKIDRRTAVNVIHFKVPEMTNETLTKILLLLKENSTRKYEISNYISEEEEAKSEAIIKSATEF